VTAFFFIGSEETYERLLLDLPLNFMKRTSVGIVLGLLGGVIIVLGNLLLDRGQKNNRKQRLIKVGLATFLLSVIASLIGTTVFFSN
jgi:hypothetical protein